MADRAAVDCWDGSGAASKADCGRPTGVEGLRWVFPSLDQPGLACDREAAPAGNYRVGVGRECSVRVGGEPVTITFEQVASREAADAAIDHSFAGTHMREIPGARGGRCTWFDTGSTPARAVGYYEGYPYVVTVRAQLPRTVKRTWITLVRFRTPATVRGIRS